MAFDYDKIKHHRDSGESFWTAYSDLFSVLSAIFLLLYVVSSVRSGTFSIQKEVQYQVLAKEAQDLKDQIRIYNALRDETVEQSSDDEQKQYKMLMDKLSLLQEESNGEKKDLIEKSRQLAQKEMALNKYQQMIRNIVNVNMLSKRQIKQRDFLIAKKDFDITEKDGEIRGLNTDIEKKEKVIEENNERIASIQDRLADQIKRVRLEQKSSRLTKDAMNKKIANLQQSSEQQINAIEGKNASIARDLQMAKTSLSLTQNALENTQGKLQTTVGQLENVKEQSAAEKQSLLGKISQVQAQSDSERNALMGKMQNMQGKSAAEKQALLGQLEGAKQGFQKQLNDLKSEGEARMASEKAAFDKALTGEKLSGAAKAAREAAFRQKAEGEAGALRGALAGLGNKIGEAERQLADAREKEGRYVASVDKLAKENQGLSQDLKRAKEVAEAKKKLVQNIRDNFNKAGIKADVDDKTGDVFLSFGDDYFESGRADLKESMQRRLEKFIPQYSKSLFSDPKTAQNIASVEIIGFASSTYKGKYVNPQSLKTEDREAVDYNLKLSFNRANSIFKHIFDKDRLQYDHQKDLLPLVKVVGRGYLPDGKQPGDIPSGMPERDFCKKFNCAKAQKVIIKFNLKE